MFKKKNFSLLIVTAIFLFQAGCKNFSFDGITGASLPFDPDGNSMYHQSDETAMQPNTLEVLGEVEESGVVDLTQFYKREVVLRGAKLLDNGECEFAGAYRYIGYSHLDLLHTFNHQKKNKEEFPPAIDLYVVVENDKGEAVSLSWGEIFYTLNPHQILISTVSAPVKPYKVEVEYPVEKQWKLVIASDLYSNRQLVNPVKITVKSFDKKDYVIDREIDPLFAPEMVISFADTLTIPVNDLLAADRNLEYKTIFYGMGMGHHPNPGFKGISLEKVMDRYVEDYPTSWLRNGLVCFAGMDGYRTVYSFSELFYRADFSATMLQITEEMEDGGRYRIFSPGDFYADRSVKSLAEMYIFTE